MTTRVMVDFSSEESKRNLYNELKKCEGTKEILIKNGRVSNNMLGYYFAAIVKPLSDMTGDNPEEIHYYLKSLYAKILVEVQGRHIFKVMDTEEMDAYEFSQYIEKCIRYCSEEHNIIIHSSEDYIQAQAKAKERYWFKISSIVSSIKHGECFSDKGKMYANVPDGYNMPEYIMPTRRMDGATVFFKSGESGYKISAANNVFWVRAPGFVKNGVSSISFEHNQIVVK